MYVIAHIAGIPVEEWLPFLVPVVALYLFGRRRNRRREQALERLPGASELGEDETRRILASWSESNHEISSDYVRLLYPPGPDGMTAGELAARIHADPAAIERQLEALE